MGNCGLYCFQETYCFAGQKVDFPSRQQLAKEQDIQTSLLRQKIKALIDGVKNLSITVDIWSRKAYTAAFGGITAHFYCEKSGTLNHLLLACQQIQQPHTAIIIGKLYQQIMADWSIPETKIFRIITDNGSNVIKAFRYIFIFVITCIF